jgi:hypothetical protein
VPKERAGVLLVDDDKDLLLDRHSLERGMFKAA